jgi:serine/threonine-protein kinase
VASASPTRTSFPDPEPPRGTAPARRLSADPSGGGRFLPGTVLARRYRVLGLLGSGGMGEVYRADDLKLGQAVALKFLPASVEKDEGRLQRFLNEVKIARQISHPNVCRVYDVGEVDDHHFLSMEYVDGEDLASLLRRIGRLPTDKAVQISREMCMGLAAAHEQGILHRDLKPANVMIDGRGRAKIADFGLAAIAGGPGAAEVGAGTPRYMAPEQLAGKEATVRSDLYALGLVLYELTTGKPASNAASSASPSSLVKGFDPATERVILRCLQNDPALRPASALAVAAALPGGDPLAAALAAGETPSPEMVAAAAAPGSLSPRAAWTCLVVSLMLAVLEILTRANVQLLHLVPLDKTPEVLADHARDTIHRLGYEAQPFESQGFSPNDPFLRHVQESDASPGRWEVLRKGQPSALRFWFKESPVDLTPSNPAYPLIQYDDPPLTIPTTIGVWLDTKGRLLRLDAVPPQHRPTTAPSSERKATNWSTLFAAAGMEIDTFRPIPAEWSPLMFADERQAWQGVYPDASDVPIRVEAAAFAGRPVSFRIIEPWAGTEDSPDSSRSFAQSLMSALELALPILVLIGGAFLAVRNIRLGRSDRRGAFRLSVYLFVIRMLAWLFMPKHFAGATSRNFFFSHLASALYQSVVVWTFYVAIEPYLRQLWPRTMISWARALEGRWRDPLVGRDVLLGALSVGAMCLGTLGWPLISGWFGVPAPAGQLGGVDTDTLYSLGGLKPALSMMLLAHAGVTLTAGFLLIVLLVLLRLLARRTWIAVAIWLPLLVSLNLNGEADRVMFLAVGVLWLTLLFRFGVLCLIVGFGLLGLQLALPATLDSAVWYSGPSWVCLALTAGVAIYGFIVSLGGRRAFGSVSAEE